MPYVRLLEVLVRGAVIPPWQRLALAWGASPGAGAAAPRITERGHVLGKPGKVLVGELDVMLDDQIDDDLISEREAASDLLEQRALRAGEVAAVLRHPLHRRLAGLEQPQPVPRAGRVGRIADHPRCQSPVNRSADLVHE